MILMITNWNERSHSYCSKWLSVNPEYSLHDVIRCHLCEYFWLPLCDLCKKYLCVDCEEKHCTDESTEHKVVQFKFQGCITKCQKHFFIICDKFCEQCNSSFCQQCISSTDHSLHVFVNLVGKLDCKFKKKSFQRDLTDFEKHFPPKYQEIISDIQVKTCFLKENS